MTWLPTTGERTVPEAPREAYWYARHEVVYRWLADRVASGECWLDAGSGEGYGTAALAEAGASAVGVELDAEAATHSAWRYRAASFARANLIALPFRDNSFDAVASLQVVEHIWDVRRFLLELMRVVRRGGSIYLSTPNRPVFSPGLERGMRPTNPFHVEEFDAGQISDLLCEAGLQEVEVLGVHHGRRIVTWERSRGSIVAAQVEAVVTGSWPSDVEDFVESVTAADFVVTPATDDAHDLLAFGRVA